MSLPHEGLLDTYPPTHPPNHHRKNALTSTFCADPKSPTMAYPTGRGGGGGALETHPPRNSEKPTPSPSGRTHTKKNPESTAQLDNEGTPPPLSKLRKSPKLTRSL